MHVLLDERRKPPELLERELAELLALGEAVADGAPHDLVGFAERHALAHEVVGEVRGRGVEGAGGFAHAVDPERQALEHGRQHPQHPLEGVHRVEERLLVLLHVGVVGQRQPFHRGQHGHQIAVETARLPADQLGHVRVLLLRHDRRARREGVRELDEAELRGGPEREVGGQPRAVHAEHGCRRQELRDVVPVGHGVHAVRAGHGEAQVAGERLAVDGEGRAGQRGRAQRQHVDAPGAVGEALAIAVEHADVGEEVMGEEHRLGALEVRVPGHRRLTVPFGLVQERRLHGLQRRVEVAEHVAEVEALVESDLVVARAPRVELPAHLARDLDETALDVHVDVFELPAKGESAALELRAHGLEALVDGRALRGVDESRTLERLCPRDAAANVVEPEPPVEGQRGGEGLGRGVGPRREAAPPGLA